MGILTGALYGLLLVYLGGWYVGKWTGNFSLLLFILSVVTLAYWLAERFHFAPQRAAAAKVLEEQEAARRAQLAAQGITKVDTDIAPAREKLLMQPWWLDWTAGLFPVILAVFLLRSFLFEPFKIPSGSMIPTLEVGDHIFVNKYVFGLQVPWTTVKFLEHIREPRRGEVIVFDSAEDDLKLVKRLIGVPGDTLEMQGGVLYLNGLRQAEPWVRHTDAGKGEFAEVRRRMREWQLPHLAADPVDYTPDLQHWGPIVVPPDSYFVMGDNRDNSYDSRYWGFIPRRAVRGTPLCIYFSYDPDSWQRFRALTTIRWERLLTRPR